MGLDPFKRYPIPGCDPIRFHPKTLLHPESRGSKRLSKNPWIWGSGDREMATALATRTRLITKRSSKYLEEALYKRLFREGSSPESVRKELTLFLKSRKRVFKWEVGVSIKRLRNRKRYQPALKVPSLSLSLLSSSMIISRESFDLFYRLVWMINMTRWFWANCLRSLVMHC